MSDSLFACLLYSASLPAQVVLKNSQRLNALQVLRCGIQLREAILNFVLIPRHFYCVGEEFSIFFRTLGSCISSVAFLIPEFLTCQCFQIKKVKINADASMIEHSVSISINIVCLIRISYYYEKKVSTFISLLIFK